MKHLLPRALRISWQGKLPKCSVSSESRTYVGSTPLDVTVPTGYTYKNICVVSVAEETGPEHAAEDKNHGIDSNQPPLAASSQDAVSVPSDALNSVPTTE